MQGAKGFAGGSWPHAPADTAPHACGGHVMTQAGPFPQAELLVMMAAKTLQGQKQQQE